MEYTDALRPMLERFGLHPDLHLVLFTVDETVFSREIAPLAGFYPSVYVGAPWWFLDAPDAIRRWRSAVTETVGFSNAVRVRRRHPRLLLDPGPARHGATSRRRLPRASSSSSTGSRRTRRTRRSATLVDSPRRVFKL